MTVIVVDATRLERNLNLALQVLEITDRAVVCVNLIDEARRDGIEVDVRRLARDLGVPVVATAARSGEGLDELRRAVAEVATGETVCRPRRLGGRPPALDAAIERLATRVASIYPGLPNAPWVALRLIDGDVRIAEALRTGELSELRRDGRGRTTSGGSNRSGKARGRSPERTARPATLRRSGRPSSWPAPSAGRWATICTKRSPSRSTPRPRGWRSGPSSGPASAPASTGGAPSTAW